MRRFSLLLLAAAQQGLARQPGFSIHDDLLAYPQFEVVFSERLISEHEAQSLVDRSKAHPTYDAGFTSQSDLSHVREATQGEGSEENMRPEFEYEIMNMPPNKYLCSIPVLEDLSSENRTATELAKAEEQKELARASERGWELLKGMNGDCLHFMSGWWSYRFCYGRDIVQYHALPSVPTGLPPVQDPQTAAYILGRTPNTPSTDSQVAQNKRSVDERGRPPNTDLQVKGDQRYLVQRLDGGTICDLTGRERTIEVQYHCLPTMVNDRIAWIKEVTTCAYLMVVNTPRLCDDVAFLPPQPMTANPITCQPIITSKGISQDPSALDGEDTGWEAVLAKQQESKYMKLGDSRHPPVIGGIVIGGHNILASDGEGSTAVTLEAPHNYMPGKSHVVVVASRSAREEGGIRESYTKESLEKLGLDPALVDDMVKELEKIAGDKGWKLEVVEEPGRAREIRGVVDVEGEDSEEETKRKKNAEEEAGSEEQFFQEEL